MKKIIFIILIVIAITLIVTLPKEKPVELGGVTDYSFSVGGEIVQVGGEMLLGAESKFKPEVKLNKWGDESYLKVWTNDEVEDRASVVSNKVVSKSKDGKKEYNFYPTTYTTSGGEDIEAFEYEVILNEKPKSNVIELKLELKDIECYYQPELTQKEIDNGAIRPDDVIGSYACYHISKSGDYSKIGGKNYATGKAFHIYRPRIVDAKGDWTWGELEVKSDSYTVTIPQKFLDNAEYPIKHATGATFGYTSVGATELFIVSAQAHKDFGKFYTAIGGENIESLSAYIITPSSGTIGITVYTVSGGLPDSRVATPSTLTAAASADWETASVDIDLSGGTNYVVAIGDETGSVKFYGDSGTGDLVSFNTNATLPATWTDAGTSFSYYTSMYATYAEAPHTCGNWALHIIDGATLAASAINSTSTDICVEEDSFIKLWEAS